MKRSVAAQGDFLDPKSSELVIREWEGGISGLDDIDSGLQLEEYVQT